MGSIPISHPIFRMARFNRYTPWYCRQIIAARRERELADQKSKELRADARRRTILGGKLISDSGQICDCLIMDLSLAGVRCRCDEPLDSKTFVNVRIDRFGELRRAQVMWVRGDQVGLRFIEKVTGTAGTTAGIGRLLQPMADGPRSGA